MELEGVRDVERVSARYRECLAGENHDRPVLHVTASKGRAVAWPPPPGSLEQKWLDFDQRIDCYEAGLSNTHFEAEGFPTLFCNLGPDIMAACLGAELVLADDTTWVEPAVADSADHPPLRFNPDGKPWRDMEAYLKLSAERGRNRWLTGTGDLHGNADALSALRGPQTFCLDVLLYPDEIKRRLDECFVAWKEMVDRHIAIAETACGGLVSSWLQAALPGRYVVMQNDFSCMVSPETFRELFLDEHRREAAYLDYAVYHWDGPGAIPHREALCEIEGLHAIQWTPGEGNPPMREWIPLLKEVQAGGKGLYLACEAENVIPLVENLAPEGVIIATGAATPEDARALVREVERVCAAR